MVFHGHCLHVEPAQDRDIHDLTANELQKEIQQLWQHLIVKRLMITMILIVPLVMNVKITLNLQALKDKRISNSADSI